MKNSMLDLYREKEKINSTLRSKTEEFDFGTDLEAVIFSVSDEIWFSFHSEHRPKTSSVVFMTIEGKVYKKTERIDDMDYVDLELVTRRIEDYLSQEIDYELIG